MAADRRLGFYELGAIRAFPKVSTGKRRDEPTDRSKKDRKNDRGGDVVFLLADQVADDAVNDEPKNEPFHARRILAVLPSTPQ